MPVRLRGRQVINMIDNYVKYKIEVTELDQYGSIVSKDSSEVTLKAVEHMGIEEVENAAKKAVRKVTDRFRDKK